MISRKPNLKTIWPQINQTGEAFKWERPLAYYVSETPEFGDATIVRIFDNCIERGY